jgi:two-component system, OmpR family, phosphate regulon response regulator PhoB
MTAMTASSVLTVSAANDDEGARALHALLRAEGLDVLTAATGLEALDLLGRKPDVVLLDLVLPVVSGLEVLASVRAAGTTPVVVHTALDAEETVVRALDLGADDYIVTPSRPREVAARLRAVLRRSGVTATRNQILHGTMAIDLDRREVSMRGEVVETTAREFDLLVFLAKSPGVVFTRDRLLRSVWNSSSQWQQEGTVTEHIRRLREKIELDPRKPDWLRTVRGVGYRFERRHAEGRSGRPADAPLVERRRREEDEVLTGLVAAPHGLVEAGNRG